MTYSFDIFDTCLVRKCGTPQNMLDVLSLRAFQSPVSEEIREHFCVERKKAEDRQWLENPFSGISDIYKNLQFTHELLYSLEDLVSKELQLEKELLVPVLHMKENIDVLRKKGHHIIYISDMYLPDEFIREIMTQYGFLLPGDSLYVSCQVGKQKSDGGLYQYVHESENLEYSKWYHTGDNKLVDYIVPRKLGIHTSLIDHKYNPYPNDWQSSDYSVSFKYKSILAGLSRATSLSNEENTHRDFVTDIIAPFYCSWTYQVLADANLKGYKRLYFCARDARIVYKMAQTMNHLFPSIALSYLYISRKSLYEGDPEARLQYFIQEGLATKTDKVAIVDTTTGGTTMLHLNSDLTTAGYKEVGCYYYQMWSMVDGVETSKFNWKVYDEYVWMNQHHTRLLQHYFIYENFFALNNEQKTVDYAVVDGVSKPVFDPKIERVDCYIKNLNYWTEFHEQILVRYSSDFVNLGLGVYSCRIFEEVAMATISRFMEWPIKKYVIPLEDMSSCFDQYPAPIPCVKRMPLWKIYMRLDRSYYWRRGTIVLNTPRWLIKLRLLLS